MLYRILSAITMIADLSGGGGPPAIPEKTTPPAIVKPKPLAESYKEQDKVNYKKARKLVEDGSTILLVMGLYEYVPPSTKDRPVVHLWYALDGFENGAYECSNVNGVCVMKKGPNNYPVQFSIPSIYPIPFNGQLISPDCPTCIKR